VNTYAAYGQCDHAIVMDKKGNFVVAWESWEQDGSDMRIFAKMFKK